LTLSPRLFNRQPPPGLRKYSGSENRAGPPHLPRCPAPTLRPLRPGRPADNGKCRQRRSQTNSGDLQRLGRAALGSRPRVCPPPRRYSAAPRPVGTSPRRRRTADDRPHPAPAHAGLGLECESLVARNRKLSQTLATLLRTANEMRPEYVRARK
jgi:hypothetical protein